MWVKPPAGERVRDYRTGRLWPIDEASGDTLPFEIPAGDPAFGQMLNHGALVECQESDDPLPTSNPAPAAPTPPARATKTAAAPPAPASTVVTADAGPAPAADETA